jgi:hypothetical protein
MKSTCCSGACRARRRPEGGDLPGHAGKNRFATTFTLKVLPIGALLALKRRARASLLRLVATGVQLVTAGRERVLKVN